MGAAFNMTMTMTMASFLPTSLDHSNLEAEEASALPPRCLSVGLQNHLQVVKFTVKLVGPPESSLSLMVEVGVRWQGSD